ncbi:MAG: hypothetical protein JW839_11405 [Candidatus Lokiarchaeota archaeon]|nr:hypothetical protein [Candidatus Lokiarchaeota archaeon]
MEHQPINPIVYAQSIAQNGQQPEHGQEEKQAALLDSPPREKRSKWQRFVEILNGICAVTMQLFHPQNELDRFLRPAGAITEARWRSHAEP